MVFFCLTINHHIFHALKTTRSHAYYPEDGNKRQKKERKNISYNSLYKGQPAATASVLGFGSSSWCSFAPAVEFLLKVSSSPPLLLSIELLFTLEGGFSVFASEELFPSILPCILSLLFADCTFSSFSWKVYNHVFRIHPRHSTRRATEQWLGPTTRVTFSSFSSSEFSVSRLISDLSATFSAIKDSTFLASSSVSAWKGGGGGERERERHLPWDNGDWRNEKSWKWVHVKHQAFSFHLFPQSRSPGWLTVRLFPPLSFQFPFILSPKHLQQLARDNKHIYKRRATHNSP